MTKGGEPPALPALPGGWFGLRRPPRDGARDAVRGGYVSGGTRRTLEWVRPHLVVGPGVSEDDLLLLADAQTSGGLLVVGEVPGGVVVGETLAGAPHLEIV